MAAELVEEVGDFFLVFAGGGDDECAAMLLNRAWATVDSP